MEHPWRFGRSLWHGADADVIEQAAQRGFDTSHTSLEFDVCGAGLYFAPDPRLSHHFCKDVRGRPHARCRLILARVAVGYCVERDAVPSKPVQEG